MGLAEKVREAAMMSCAMSRTEWLGVVRGLDGIRTNRSTVSVTVDGVTEDVSIPYCDEIEVWSMVGTGVEVVKLEGISSDCVAWVVVLVVSQGPAEVAYA